MDSTAPDWLTGLLAGGGSTAVMGFIIWRVFMYVLPGFTEALQKQRNDFLGALKEQRDLDRQQLEKERALDREERSAGHNRILDALKEQTVLLSKLAGNSTKPPG